MKIKTFLIVGLALCLSSSLALAATSVVGTTGAFQSFTAANIDQDGAPYWDQVSLDGGNRNVGYFLTGTGGVFSTNFLGASPQFFGNTFNSATDTGGSADPSFFLTTTLPSSTDKFLARITAATGTDTIGIYNTVGGAQTLLFGPGDAVGTTKTVALPSSFGFYGIGVGSATYFSQSGLNPTNTGQQHFALFQDAGVSGVFYVGFEDTAGTGGTEGIGDFNDLVIQFTPVPVPPTVLLLGSGLLGLIGLRRVRKS